MKLIYSQADIVEIQNTADERINNYKKKINKYKKELKEIIYYIENHKNINENIKKNLIEIIDELIKR